MFFSPGTLNDIAGNKLALTTLGAMLVKKEMAPKAYIFDGPSGVGKTAVAKLFLGNFGKVIVASDTGFSDMDDVDCILVESVETLSPQSMSRLVTLIDSQTCYVALTTVSYFKLPPILKSRAYRVSLSNLPDEALSGLLAKVCGVHHADYDAGALKLVSRLAGGNPGIALTMLQGLLVHGKITTNLVKKEPVSLEDGCSRTLTALPNLPKAIGIVEELGLSHTADEIIDQLFTSYAMSYFDEGVTPTLKNYRNVASIFLKWKSGENLPLVAIPLLLKELSESEKGHREVIENEEVQIKAETPPRELGARELAQLLGAEILESE